MLPVTPLRTPSLPPLAPPSVSPRVPSRYQVGQTDVLSQFHVSQKLYGRQQQVLTRSHLRICFDCLHSPQVDELLAAFARVSKPLINSEGLQVAPPPEFILVCGYSGIGKTRVIDEVHKPMVQVILFFFAAPLFFYFVSCFVILLSCFVFVPV